MAWEPARLRRFVLVCVVVLAAGSARADGAFEAEASEMRWRNACLSSTASNHVDASFCGRAKRILWRLHLRAIEGPSRLVASFTDDQRDKHVLAVKLAAPVDLGAPLDRLIGQWMHVAGDAQRTLFGGDVIDDAILVGFPVVADSPRSKNSPAELTLRDFIERCRTADDAAFAGACQGRSVVWDLRLEAIDEARALAFLPSDKIGFKVAAALVRKPRLPSDRARILGQPVRLHGRIAGRGIEAGLPLVRLGAASVVTFPHLR